MEKMRLEGRSRKFIEDVLAQLAADGNLIQKYLDGRLTMTVETRAADANLAPAMYFAIRPEYDRMISCKGEDS